MHCPVKVNDSVLSALLQVYHVYICLPCSPYAPSRPNCTSVDCLGPGVYLGQGSLWVRVHTLIGQQAVTCLQHAQLAICCA